MDSKFVNTKNLEKQAKISKANLIKNSRDKFYENLKTVYKDNANATELQAPPKKKPDNDIIKRNLNVSKKTAPGG